VAPGFAEEIGAQHPKPQTTSSPPVNKRLGDSQDDVRCSTGLWARSPAGDRGCGGTWVVGPLTRAGRAGHGDTAWRRVVD